ncbi:IS3 family transposase [Pandoraea sp. XY-2]|uniref:IS3 family transposase n=1 Tax=Pandoraea sp. XY-2 TaxID=2518599 RepID=UPI00101B0ECB|nr:IS3 family transposase [Pandoraea sp. XY-2]QBC31820.1 IS3 family transposase [Pandoraea sp. XY-2]
MKKSRYSDEQIVRILREADRDAIPEVAKRNGVSEASIYAWRKRFGEMVSDDVKRLKTLEAENARLKKMVAERDLEIEVMREISGKKVVSAQVRCEQARFAMARGLSQRRACALMQVSRLSLSYTLKMPSKNAPVIEAMRTLSGHYPRFGSRRIRVLLGREGIVIGKDRCASLWAKAGLQVPKKRRRRRISGARPRPHAPAARNSVWCYDFVFDACANGQQVKCLTVVDEYTRECLAIDVAGSIRSRRVIEVLSRLISVHGAPRYLRSDNGPEFVSTALLKWAVQENIETALIDPGKPWQNGTNESFNGKFRDECLAMEWFRNRIEAKIVIEDWRTHYNEVRPHSSLQCLTPAEFRRASECSSTTGAVNL